MIPEEALSSFFAVLRSGDFGETYVDWTITPGTADLDSDFGHRISGTVSLTSGAVQHQFAVIVINDDKPEHDETFTITLSNLRGWPSDSEVIIERPSATGVIQNDDAFNILIGNADAEVLTGSEYIDTVSYQSSPAGVTVDLDAGTAAGGDAQGNSLIEIENLTGSDHDDNITGDANRNALEGGSGNDTLDGGANDDWLRGGIGADSISGGTGIDRFEGTSAELNGDTIIDLALDEVIRVLDASQELLQANLNVSAGSLKIDADLNGVFETSIAVTGLAATARFSISPVEGQATGIDLILRPPNTAPVATVED